VHARRWKTLGVLALSLVIIGLDNTILNVALPTLQDEFDASSSTLQWMVDSYLLVFAGLLLVFGTLGDRLGRKLALQSGIAVFGLASLGALFADTAGQVILIRALMGVGAALIMPATLSIIANVFPAEERGKAIGIWAALAAVGIGLGPLVGGLLIEWFDWSAVFLVNVPIALIAVLLGVRLVPESRDPNPGGFDMAGAVLSTAGFSVLVYAVIEAPEQGWASGPRPMPTAASAAQIPIALPRSSGGKTFAMIESVAGMISAAPTPISARMTMTSPDVSAMSAPTLASPKTVMPACSASLRPNRSPSVPNTRRSPAKTSR